MRKLFLSILLVSFALFAHSQNVGIGTTLPAEKLDVNGNINLNGTIKVNGVDGSANQVLMKNSAGIFGWGDLSQYKNVVGFKGNSSPTLDLAYSWTVPAGVTKIFIEAWGGGGGGAVGGGGGGGGYAAIEWSTTPLTILNITVGAGGAGAINAGSAGTAGNQTSVVMGGIAQIIAYAGGNATISQGGPGGRFLSNLLPSTVFGQGGSPGEASTETYGTYSATGYFTAVYFGSGGMGANTTTTMRNGGFRSFNTGTTATIKAYTSNPGAEPGGGGGGNQIGGSYGAPGLVIIRY